MGYVPLPDALARKIITRGIAPVFPAQRNRSEWTGQSKIILLPGNERWNFKLTWLPLSTEAEIREARAFFWALRGIGNTFEVPFLPRPQGGAATSVAGSAGAGATQITVADASDIEPGMPISITLPSNHKRLVIVTEKDGNDLTFSPSLTEGVTTGAAVEISNPVAHVRLIDPQFQFTDENGLAGFGLDVEEAIGEAGSVPGPATFELFLDFTSQEYWQNGDTMALASLAGYSFSRTGTQGAVDEDGGVDWFTANVPAINARGYHAFEPLTNFAAHSQQFGSWAPYAGAAVTSDIATAPDGTSTVDRLTFGSDATSEISKSISSSGKLTFSVWAWTDAGTKKFRFKSYDGANFYSPEFTATTTPQRFVWTRDQATHLQMAIANETAGGVGNVLNLWQAQVIAGDEYTDGGPVIATAGAAAAIGFPLLSVGDALGAVSIDQLFICRFVSRAPSDHPICYWGAVGGGGGYVQMRTWGAAVRGIVWNGSVGFTSVEIPYTAGDDVIGVLRRLGGDWRFGLIKGGVLTWSASETVANWPSGVTTVQPGTDHGVGSQAVYGQIKGVSRKLGTFTTDEQVIAAAEELL